MKRKIPLIIASLAMLVGCGSGASSKPSSDVNSQFDSVNSISSVTNSTSEANSSKPNSSTSHMPIGGSSSNKPSSSSSTSKPSSGTSNGGGNNNSSLNSTITDPETGEIIDLNGYVAVATQPEGVTLTDWTDEMKAIFVLYLYQTIPPFMPMDNIIVSMDNLGILQAKGNAANGAAEKYAQILNANNYMAYTVKEEKCTRVYGRGIGNGFMISIDGLEINGIFSINFSFDIAKSEWPAEGIAMELSAEMYQGTTTVVPPYVYENAQYYPSANGFGEIQILCLGAPRTSVAEYSTILENNHWEVKPYDDQGTYTAISRDKKVVMIYYYDGTGLQIVIGFGEGENYTTWNDCIAAFNDFGRVELGLTRDIGGEIPEVLGGELYEIDRSIRGSLQVTAYRTISYKQEDIFNYAMAAQATGKFTAAVKGDYYWVLSNDKSYAIRLELLDYVDDLLATTTIVFTLCDYRIYEGAYVYYGTWPTAQAATIAKNINPSFTLPAYVEQNATYYVYSDYNTTFKVEVHNPGTNALAKYKAILEDNSFVITNSDANGFVAVDRLECAKVTVSMKNGEMVILLEKYVKSTVSNGKAAFDFTGKSQLLSSVGYTSKTWNNGPINFLVEQNTSSRDVGNYGDYLANPLRLYKGQKVTISTTEGNLTKLEFFVTNKSAEGRDIKNFDASYLKDIAIVGATFESYNSVTGLVRFNVNSGVNSVSFVVNGNYMTSDGGFGLLALDVFYGN